MVGGRWGVRMELWKSVFFTLWGWRLCDMCKFTHKTFNIFKIYISFLIYQNTTIWWLFDSSGENLGGTASLAKTKLILKETESWRVRLFLHFLLDELIKQQTQFLLSLEKGAHCLSPFVDLWNDVHWRSMSIIAHRENPLRSIIQSLRMKLRPSPEETRSQWVPPRPRSRLQLLYKFF